MFLYLIGTTSPTSPVDLNRLRLPSSSTMNRSSKWKRFSILSFPAIVYFISSNGRATPRPKTRGNPPPMSPIPRISSRNFILGTRTSPRRLRRPLRLINAEDDERARSISSVPASCTPRFSVFGSNHDGFIFFILLRVTTA